MIIDIYVVISVQQCPSAKACAVFLVLQSIELTDPFPEPPASPLPDRLGSSSLTLAVQGQLWAGLKVTKKPLAGLDPLSTGSEQPGEGRGPFCMGRSWTLY